MKVYMTIESSTETVEAEEFESIEKAFAEYTSRLHNREYPKWEINIWQAWSDPEMEDHVGDIYYDDKKLRVILETELS